MPACTKCSSEFDTYSKFVACYSCNKTYHCSCAQPKIKEGVAANLCDKNSGLRWFCITCRNGSPVDNASMLNLLCESYSSIKQTMVCLINHVDQHGSNFNSFCRNYKVPFVENLISGTTNTSINNAEHTFEAAASQLVPAGTHNVALPTAIDNVTNLDAIANVTNVDVNVDDGVTDVAPIQVNVTRQRFVPAEITIDLETNISDFQSAQPHTLTIVEPPDVIFISRLKYGTKPLDILNYLKSKNIDTTRMRCICVTPENEEGREISSFKLYLPTQFCSTILNTNFWPNPKILVKRFLSRKRYNKPSSNAKN